MSAQREFNGKPDGVEVTGGNQLKEPAAGSVEWHRQRCGDLVPCALLEINALTLCIANAHAHNLWAS